MELFNRELLDSFLRGVIPPLTPDIEYHKHRITVHLGEGTIVSVRNATYYIDNTQRVDLRYNPLVISSPHLTITNDPLVITLTYDNKITVAVYRSKTEINKGHLRLIVNHKYAFTYHTVFRVKIGETHYHETLTGEYVISTRLNRLGMIGRRTPEGSITFITSGRKMTDIDSVIEVDNLTYHIKNGNNRREKVYRAITDSETVAFPPSFRYSRTEFMNMMDTVEGMKNFINQLHRSRLVTFEWRSTTRQSNLEQLNLQSSELRRSRYCSSSEPFFSDIPSPSQGVMRFDSPPPETLPPPLPETLPTPVIGNPPSESLEDIVSTISFDPPSLPPPSLPPPALGLSSRALIEMIKQASNQYYELLSTVTGEYSPFEHLLHHQHLLLTIMVPIIERANRDPELPPS